MSHSPTGNQQERPEPAGLEPHKEPARLLLPIRLPPGLVLPLPSPILLGPLRVPESGLSLSTTHMQTVALKSSWAAVTPHKLEVWGLS